MIFLFCSGSPHIGDFDAGEFYKIAITGGISHPPGYPIYCLFNRIIYLASGSLEVFPFWRFNAFLTLIAAFIFYHYLLHQRFGLLGLASLAIVFLAPSIWRSATNIEPFALHHLLVVIAILMAEKFETHSDKKTYCLIWGFIFGLAFCHHHLFAMLLPGTLWCLRRKISVHRGSAFILGSLLGLLPIIYFIFARKGGFIWGNWDPFIANLLKHLFRTQYGTVNLGLGNDGQLMMGLYYFGKLLALHLGGLGAALAVLGIYQQVRQGLLSLRDQWLLCGTCLAGPLFFCLARIDGSDIWMEVLSRFIGTSCLLLLPFIAVGIRSLGEKAKLTGVIIVLFQGVLQLPYNWRQNESFTEDHIQNLINTVASEGKTEAFLVTFHELEFMGFLHYSAKHGLPPHLKVAHHPMWGAAWYRQQAFETKEASFEFWLRKKLNLGTRIYFTSGVKRFAHIVANSYPIGPTIRIRAPGSSLPSGSLNFKRNKLLLQTFRTIPHEVATTWEKTVFDSYTRTWLSLGNKLEDENNKKLALEAIQIASGFQESE